jgi:hypothetical protein
MHEYRADVGTWQRGVSHKLQAASDLEALGLAMKLPKWDQGEELVGLARDSIHIWDEISGHNPLTWVGPTSL